jgi:hypothetical protein
MGNLSLSKFSESQFAQKGILYCQETDPEVTRNILRRSKRILDRNLDKTPPKTVSGLPSLLLSPQDVSPSLN